LYPSSLAFFNIKCVSSLTVMLYWFPMYRPLRTCIK
jgi:hypothetical protein